MLSVSTSKIAGLELRLSIQLDSSGSLVTGTHHTELLPSSPDPLTLCPRGLDGPSDNNSQPPHPPAIYCSEESNMMRDGGGGEGDIWFIWKGPRVNRSCGTAKFPSGQLVDVCCTLPRGTLEVAGGAGSQKD